MMHCGTRISGLTERLSERSLFMTSNKSQKLTLEKVRTRPHNSKCRDKDIHSRSEARYEFH